MGVAAIWTAYTASEGLSTWREQMKGQNEYEVANKLHLQTLKLRNELKFLRIPVIHSSEIPVNSRMMFEQPSNEPSESKAEGVRAALDKRWAKLIQAWDPFAQAALEAQALWGDSAYLLTYPIDEKIRQLRKAHDIYIEQIAEMDRPRPDMREFYTFQHAIAFGTMKKDPDEKNEFTAKLEQSLSDLEHYLMKLIQK